MSNSQLDLRSIAVPTFDASNDLLVKANENLQKSAASMGTRLAAIDANTQAMNMAELSKYVQSATTPEQLNSTEFKQGYDRLVSGFRNQYDVKGEASLLSGQQDLLSMRAKASQDLLHTQAETAATNQKRIIDTRTDKTLQYTMNYVNAPPDKRDLIMKTALADGVTIDPKYVADIRDTNSQITNRNTQTEEMLKNGVSTRMKTSADIGKVKADTVAQNNVNVVGTAEANAFGDANRTGERSSNYSYNIGRVQSKQFNESALKYEPQIKKAAETYGVNQNLILAVMGAESVGDPNATSKTKVKGLMQVTGKTYAGMGLKGDHSKPENSINGGAKYLAYLQKVFPNDLDKVIVAYNRGEGAVGKAVEKYGDEWKKDKALAQGTEYLPRVRDNLTYLSSGLDGSKVVYPGEMRVTAPGSGGKGAATIGAAYDNSPQGIAQAYKKELNTINSTKLSVPDNMGVGTYASVAELKDKERNMLTNNAMLDNLSGAILGANYKFKDAELQKQYKVKGVDNIHLLSDKQKAYVIETTMGTIRTRNSFGTNDWSVNDADLINYQRIAQPLVDQLLSGSRKERDLKAAAARSNYLSTQGLKHQISAQEAENLAK